MKSKNNEVITTTPPRKPFQFNQEQTHMLREYFEGPELNTTIRNLTYLLIHCVGSGEDIFALYPEINTLTGLLGTAMHMQELQGRTSG